MVALVGLWIGECNKEEGQPRVKAQNQGRFLPRNRPERHPWNTLVEGWVCLVGHGAGEASGD